MSQQSSNKPSKGAAAVSRRRFVQSTALLTGLSVSGRQLVQAAPAEAAEPLAGIRIAQAPPIPAARAVPVPAPAQGVAAPPISVEEFIRLSRVLTGFDDLGPDLAEQYLQRCSHNDKVQPLLKDLVNALPVPQGSPVEIEQKLLVKLQADNGRLFGAAEQIIYLWYVGGFFHPNPSNKGPGSWDYGPPDHYFRGKAWAAIGVNPPITPRNRVYWTQPRTEV
jgi:D-sorbitol dehydrogenase-like protein